MRRPFRVSLTDADGVILETWQLENPSENCECPWVEANGRMPMDTAHYFGEQIAEEVNRAQAQMDKDGEG